MLHLEILPPFSNTDVIECNTTDAEGEWDLPVPPFSNTDVIECNGRWPAQVNGALIRHSVTLTSSSATALNGVVDVSDREPPFSNTDVIECNYKDPQSESVRMQPPFSNTDVIECNAVAMVAPFMAEFRHSVTLTSSSATGDYQLIKVSKTGRHSVTLTSSSATRQDKSSA